MEIGDSGKEPAGPAEPAGAAKGPAKSEKKAAETAKAEPKPTPKPADRRKLLRWGVVALAVIVGVIAWLATRDGGGSSEPAPEAATPRIVTVAELREAAVTLGQPIYWAGPEAGKELELNELGEGGTQVRYLPEGTEAGAGSVKSLTIGSYPLSDPTEALNGFAKRPDSHVFHATDGSEVVVSEKSPTSVYFASPDNSVQVEVYDPSAKRAMNLALSGKVQPAG